MANAQRSIKGGDGSQKEHFAKVGSAVGRDVYARVLAAATGASEQGRTTLHAMEHQLGRETLQKDQARPLASEQGGENGEQGGQLVEQGGALSSEHEAEHGRGLADVASPLNDVSSPLNDVSSPLNAASSPREDPPPGAPPSDPPPRTPRTLLHAKASAPLTILEMSVLVDQQVAAEDSGGGRGVVGESGSCEEEGVLGAGTPRMFVTM
ncbi:hypothetical protein T484DRAFT_1941348 [Baffinella frigidus]|nr:hypothetical protein T484DRAFT_1941348 [Cryptophyta sp. CCMP2293]